MFIDKWMLSNSVFIGVERVTRPKLEFGLVTLGVFLRLRDAMRSDMSIACNCSFNFLDIS